MTKAWALTKLSEVLQPISRRERVDLTKEYRLLGIRLDGVGPFHRETIQGSQSAATFLYKVKTGDFIYSRLFACRGAFGVIGSDLDGCYVSGEFPTFVTIDDRVDANFLKLWFRLPMTIRKVDSNCTGSTPLTRNRFKENFFLDLDIPLPPVTEQRRIVAKIDDLSAKIEDARRLRQQALEESEVLTYAMSQELFGKPDKAVGDIADVTKLAGFEYTEYFTQAVPGNVIVVRAGNVRNKGLDLSNAMTITEEVSDALPRSQLKSGDVLMTFIGAKIGDVTYVRPNQPRLHCGPNVAKLTPHKCISTLYFVKVLQSSLIQRQIEEITKSTAQPSLSMKTIRQLKLPVPPLSEQEQIVTYMDKLQAKVDALKQFQKQTAAELDALMPSILDKAFKGEL